MIKPAYSVSFLLSINIFVWQNVLYFLDAARSTDVKERVDLYFYPPSGPSWPILGRTLPLPLLIADIKHLFYGMKHSTLFFNVTELSYLPLYTALVQPEATNSRSVTSCREEQLMSAELL